MIYSYSILGRHGALGNQLFEMAGTVGEAIRDNAEVSFPRWEYEPYFSVPSVLFDNRVGDRDFSGDYLQNLNHFNHIEDLVRTFFKPSEMSREYILTRYADILCVPDKTAVHIRRANNLQLPQHHPVCDLAYFEAAIDKVEAKQLVVFSDDLDWCKQQSIFKGAYFADGNPQGIDVMQLTNGYPLSLPTVAFDLFLMTEMDKHIISNSTFSWWGAYLANSSKVLYPMPWYGPAIDIDVEGTMIPSDWIRIEREI